MAQSRPNPLFVHAIILCVLGGVLTIYGSIDLIRSFSARDLLYADQRARSQMGSARMLTQAPRMGSSRNPLQAGRQLMAQGRQVKYVLQRFARYGPALLLGLGTVVVGVFLFKQKEWARIAAFGLLGAIVLSVVCVLAAQMGASGNVALPLVAVVLLSVAAAKLLWDFSVESFAAA
ncbi:MAG: hypothetical protein KatS3mg102_1066 [Planctomycetota bacterium]|nr:MAG: hypothetical protein KatS3mg102_1066 [Planctomycetota bacterium]